MSVACFVPRYVTSAKIEYKDLERSIYLPNWIGRQKIYLDYKIVVVVCLRGRKQVRNPPKV